MPLDIDRLAADALQADAMRKLTQAADILEGAAPGVDVISEIKIRRMVETLRSIVAHNRSRVVLRPAANLSPAS